MKLATKTPPENMDKAPACWEPHNHRCEHCATVWHHDPVDVLTVEQTQGYKQAQKAHDIAHNCPNCGERQGWTDGSGQTPTLLCNGIVTKPFEPSDQPPEDDARRKARMRLEFDVFMSKLASM